MFLTTYTFLDRSSAESNQTTTRTSCIDFKIGATFLTSKSTAKCEREMCLPNQLTFHHV